MDLEKLNGSYERAKRILEEKKKTIKKIEEDLKTAEGDIKIAEGAKEVAQRKNEEEDIKRADAGIKDAKSRVEKLKKEIELEKEELLMFQEKVDKIIEEIKENPELKQHLEQVLAKRYSRKIRDINKEKQEQEKEKEKEEKKIESYKEVQKLIDEHSTMRNHMQGMLNASYNIQKLNTELSKLDPIKDKARIEEIKQEIATENKRLTQNRDAILDYSNKNKLKITKETLEEIASNSVIDKKTNKVNIKETLNVSNNKSKEKIKDFNKKIQNGDKQIAINEKAIKNLGYRVPERKQKEGKDETKGQHDGSGTRGQYDGDDTHDHDKETEEKPKWWQFIKRFKKWNENKMIKQLPDPEDKSTKNSNTKSEFASSLKYDVVKDIAKQMQQDNFKEARKEVKEEGKAKEEERE